jgi:hypothetical protein
MTGVGDVNARLSDAFGAALVWVKTHQEQIVQLMQVF